MAGLLQILVDAIHAPERFSLQERSMLAHAPLSHVLGSSCHQIHASSSVGDASTYHGFEAECM